MENQVRLASNAVHSAVPWLISRNRKGNVSRKAYRRDIGSAKVKFLPMDEVKKLASGTQTRRISISRRSKSSSKSLVCSNLSEPQRSMKKKTAKEYGCHQQPSAAVHVNTPSCSNAPKLSSSLEDKTLKPVTSELIKTKAYEKNSIHWEKLLWEDGPADAEYHRNESSSASTVANRPKTGSAHQADCWNHHKVQHRQLSSISTGMCPALERIWNWKSVPK